MLSSNKRRSVECHSNQLRGRCYRALLISTTSRICWSITADSAPNSFAIAALLTLRPWSALLAGLLHQPFHPHAHVQAPLPLVAFLLLSDAPPVPAQSKTLRYVQGSNNHAIPPHHAARAQSRCRDEVLPGCAGTEGGAADRERQGALHAGVLVLGRRSRRAEEAASTRAARRWSSSPTSGTRRSTARTASSAISPTRSTTSTPPARS